MRKSIFIVCSFLIWGMSASAQKGALLADIGKSKLSTLSSKMNDQVDFCINDGHQSIAKDKAIELIRSFLKEVGPKSCRKVHVGDSKQKGSYYEVGKLKSTKGNYRVFIYYENDKIVEFRIDNY